MSSTRESFEAWWRGRTVDREDVLAHKAMEGMDPDDRFEFSQWVEEGRVREYNDDPIGTANRWWLIHKIKQARAKAGL